MTLIEWLNKNDRSVAWLSRQTKISHQTLQKYANGRKPPPGYRNLIEMVVGCPIVFGATEGEKS